MKPRLHKFESSLNWIDLNRIVRIKRMQRYQAGNEITVQFEIHLVGAEHEYVSLTADSSEALDERIIAFIETINELSAADFWAGLDGYS